MNTKKRLLRALAKAPGPVSDIRQIQGQGANGIHSLQHVLWAMQKQGLVTFKENYVGRKRILTNIALTAEGRKRSLE